MKNLVCFLFGILTMPCFAQYANDYLPATFHKEKRQALREFLPGNTAAVIFANPVRNRANDVDYIYHQNPDFYYLTGYREPNSVLVVFADPQTDSSGNSYDEIIFVQPRNEMMEMWNGKRLGTEGVKEKLGLEQVFVNTDFVEMDLGFKNLDKVFIVGFKEDVRDGNDSGDLYNLIASFKEKTAYPDDFSPRKNEFYTLIKSTNIENSANVAQVLKRSMRYFPELQNDQALLDYSNAGNDEIRSQIAEKLPESNIDGHSLDEMMNTLREIKSEAEMYLLRKAIEISAVGQREVMKAMHPKMTEREVQGIHEFVYKKYGAEYEGYPSIVGAGHNGCVLHYIENDRTELADDLVLMDLGAEYHGYTADVTRTIPASGTFTAEQRMIYDLVLKAQQAGFEACKPGAAFGAPDRAARTVINQGLVELGIIEEGQPNRYFPHGTSHYLGLDVHDRGNYEKLQAGMVITVEPGIYIPENSKCDEKWWGIAVRIEDDILITEDGWENLSAMAPRDADEIEALMAQPSPLDNFLLPTLDVDKGE